MPAAEFPEPFPEHAPGGMAAGTCSVYERAREDRIDKGLGHMRNNVDALGRDVGVADRVDADLDELALFTGIGDLLDDEEPREESERVPDGQLVE